MSTKHGNVLRAALLLGAVLTALYCVRPAGAQKKADEPMPGRYKMLDLQVGKFIYRFLFDTANGDQWVWVNGEWERPEPARDGVPWKDVKPMSGRFQLMSQVPGELDASLYVLDTAAGRVWVRTARNRSELLAPAEWQEVTVPGRTKR
jgi:hypothetical protein